jgi:hypothetical protein
MSEAVLTYDNFQESSPELASSSAPGVFKFEREDWSLFRTVEGLQQKAGVPKGRLRRLVLKELADNGLDNDADVRVGDLPGGGYFIEDDSSGIEPEEIARLFSIARHEGHDCALISSKGFSTRAARDLVVKLAEHDEAVEVFCAHDADGPGTMIYQTFQEATKARGARKIKIINLGLEPWEAIEMGLEVEDGEIGRKRKPVAYYVLDREDLAPDDSSWADWLQTHRIELNAMTTPQFIDWLDGKLAAYSKLVPPPEVLKTELHKRIEDKVRAAITQRILREANIDGVAAALAGIETPDADTLAGALSNCLVRSPAPSGATTSSQWR